MEIISNDVASLYSEDSVADYIPEIVAVKLMDGSQVKTTCYNLPANKITGTNKSYVQSLLSLATKLGFPQSYLDQIKQPVGKICENS